MLEPSVGLPTGRAAALKAVKNLPQLGIGLNRDGIAISVTSLPFFHVRFDGRYNPTPTKS
jgi:hypothetical protein